MNPSSAATLEQAVAIAAARLAEAGIEAPRREARLLLCSLLGAGPELLLARPERPLDAAESAAITAAVERRARREPVSRILGRREFWSLEFALGADTLDPRPDSETLVEAVLDWVPRRDAELRILDLGCGSGCLLLAVLSELPRARGLGIDLAPGAVAASAANARRLGLAARADFAEGSWQESLPAAGPQAAWDLVISNPPYIPTSQIAGLAPEVSVHDPLLALDGGPDGLAAYRCMIPRVGGVLQDQGLFALEVGDGQARAVRGLLEEAGLLTIRVARDLSGIERCVLATQARKSRTFA